MRNYDEGQLSFINAVENSTANLLNGSVAGSGKTTVVVEACSRLHPSGSTLVLAFNKSIAEELKERLPSYVKSSTFHSLCFQELKKRLPGKVKVNAYKVHNLVDKYVPEVKEAKFEVAKLVGMMKNLGVGVLLPMDGKTAEEIRENYDIGSDKVSNHELVTAALKVLKRNDRDLSEIDFDDMQYICLQWIVERGMPMDKYDTVFVDEFQDFNEVQLTLLESFAKRIIGVGDAYQGIYGFRGAGTNTMAEAKVRFGMEETMMNITYRCPVKVVEHAQQWVPHLRARPDAPDGILAYKEYGEMGALLDTGTMVICRMNYPLFKVALRLLRNGQPFMMTGKYPKELIKFVKRFKAKTLQEFRSRLQGWWDERVKELTEKQKFGVLSREEDKYMSLVMLLKECETVGELIESLEDMMYSSSGPVLSTVHGAKGLEAGRVVILAPELMPSKYAKTDSEMQQERNLMYVAATRAKQELYYVSDESDG